MDRLTWMYKIPRVHLEYVNGVNQFIVCAVENLKKKASVHGKEDRITCPCRDCYNEYGDPTGDMLKDFRAYVGSVVRCQVDINIESWDVVNQGLKDTIWDDIKLREQLTRALQEANNGDQVVEQKSGDSPESFGDLIKDVMSSRQDIKAFAFKTKAMIASMEHKVQSARRHEFIYWHLASHGVPRSLHCLHLC